MARHLLDILNTGQREGDGEIDSEQDTDGGEISRKG